MSKRLSDAEVEKIKHDLQIAHEKGMVVLDTSPCIYRGWGYFAWCGKCDGWWEGCQARVPEVIYKNPDGSWRHD